MSAVHVKNFEFEISDVCWARTDGTVKSARQYILKDRSLRSFWTKKLQFCAPLAAFPWTFLSLDICLLASKLWRKIMWSRWWKKSAIKLSMMLKGYHLHWLTILGRMSNKIIFLVWLATSSEMVWNKMLCWSALHRAKNMTMPISELKLSKVWADTNLI